VPAGASAPSARTVCTPRREGTLHPHPPVELGAPRREHDEPDPQPLASLLKLAYELASPAHLHCPDREAGDRVRGRAVLDHLPGPQVPAQGLYPHRSPRERTGSSPSLQVGQDAAHGVLADSNLA